MNQVINQFANNVSKTITSPDFKAALKKAESLFSNICSKIENNNFYELNSPDQNELSSVFKLKQDLSFMPFYVLNMRLNELKPQLSQVQSELAELELIKRKIAHKSTILLKELNDAKKQIHAKNAALRYAIDKDLFNDKNYSKVQADLEIYSSALNYGSEILWAVEIAPEPGADFEAFPAESKEIAMQAIQTYKEMHRGQLENYSQSFKGFNNCIRLNTWGGSGEDHAKNMLYTAESLVGRLYIPLALTKLRSYFI